MTDEFHNDIPAAPKEREAERESEIAAGVYAGLTADTGIDEKAARAVPVAGERAETTTTPAAADSPVLVELQDVRQHFLIRKAKGKKATLKAVDGVSFSIYKGETFGLVGESGSGKTVTAMALAGLLSNAKVELSGHIFFEGLDLLRASRETVRSMRGKDIAVVFQEPMTSMDPVMRIGPQVEEALLVHTDLGPEERRARALQAMADAELPDPETVYRKYPHELSGGMLQRAAAALLMALHPKYILADEPTSALDAENRTLLLELLEQQRESTGILFISHDVAALRTLCGTVYVMEHGMLTEQGTMQELLEHPKQAWTKEYAAANRPVNREGWTWTD